MTLLAILSPQEKRQFELPPKLTQDERSVYFSLTTDIKRVVSRMANHDIRAGFLLQLAYFRANARFYPVETFHKRDIKHVQSILQSQEIDLNNYSSTVSSKHRKKILSLLGWTADSFATKEILSNYAKRQANNQVKPRQIFIGMVDQCWKHQLSIPSYSDLCEIVTNWFNVAESELLDKLDELLLDTQCSNLEELLSPGKKVGSRSQPTITGIKKINQSLKPSEIQSNINTTVTFKELFNKHIDVIKHLSLTDLATEYYATWFEKADYQQLTQFPNRNKTYLYLLCFIKHQYYRRQDTLVDILLKSVTSTLHTVKSKLGEQEQATKKERNEALQILNNSHKSILAFAKTVIAIVDSKGSTPSEKYYKIEDIVRQLEGMSAEDEEKVKTLETYLSKESRNQSYYELLEAQSNKLQRRVSGIVNTLEFDRSTSSSLLLDAIDYFNAANGRITNSAPTGFLDHAELDVLYRDDSIIAPLYKCLLFIHIASAIKSGDLNLIHSYRFRAIQDYLIDKKYWDQNKDEILHEAGLSKFSDGEAYLVELKQLLDEKFHTVNSRIIENNNPYFSINSYGKPVIKTPNIEKENKEFIATTLSEDGFTPILKVLKEVNAATEFTKTLKHFSNKNVKMKPNEETILAGMIGKGCNIGVRKLANISSGISEHNLHNTVTWYFDLKNIAEANRKIVSAIHSLDLANNYIHRPSIIHSSSDGRKINVAVDSLHANYSFKYFGKDKGVTMYTFVDERQSLFYSTVFSASEREAAYVIDGLMNNDVAPNQIHSVDSHGVTNNIFASSHFIGVDFAPRFKNLSSQRLFAFSTKRTYKKKGYPLLPSRTIDRKLILQNWDDILRFMATIKTNHTTASQLFKRLSSYAKSHTLYKALQEVGRIIKTSFILTYYDDVELRQQIQKQLNRIELTNKFAHAVFFDNDQAFQDGTKEEQQLATACQVLLQNSIILWNYMYLSNLIINTREKEQKDAILKAIGQGSVITWSHVNLRGEYDFTRRGANDPQFDFKKIKALKL